MKISSCLLLITIAILPTQIILAQHPAPGWSEPKYYGIVFGKTTKADAIRIFGNPDYDGPEIESRVPIMEFKVNSPIKGKLTIYLTKTLVTAMYLDPDLKLNEEDVIKLFGKDYQVVNYEFDNCIDYGGYGPLYQTPNGQFKTFEYRKLGIIVNINTTVIHFRNHPLGPAHSRCTLKQNANQK